MSDRLRVLFVQHELYTWNRAKMWSYIWHLGLEEGLQANNVDFFTLMTPWFPRAKEILKNMHFDQVWINDLTHPFEPGGCGGPQLQEKDLEWLACIAPVRLGFLAESLEYTPDEIASNSALTYARKVMEIAGRYMTHIMTFDEKDIAVIRNIHHSVSSTMNVCPVPERFICRDLNLPADKKPAFSGTLYGSRAKWMEMPELAALIENKLSADNYTELPLNYNELQAKARITVSQSYFDPAAYGQYLHELRRIRTQSFQFFLDSLAEGSAVVNLPSFGKIYTGRVYEGMAAGRPVISMAIVNRPRMEALFQNGRDILLYDKDNPYELATHIRHIIQNPEFAQEIAMHAREKLLAYHTTEKRVAQILDWIASGQEPVYTDTARLDMAPGSLGKGGGTIHLENQSFYENLSRQEFHGVTPKIDSPQEKTISSRAFCSSTAPKLRVLFISPPYARILGLGNCRFPLSFGNMATILAQNGHTVGIYDTDFDRELIGRSANYEYTFTHQDLIPKALADDGHPIWKEVEAQVRDFSPDLVGITAMTTKYPTAAMIARIVKAVDRRIRIVIGGHHPSIFGREILRDTNIDFAVMGEGELTMLELVNRQLDLRPDFSNVAGLVYREGEKILINPPRRLIRDLDALPIIDRDLMINTDYVSDNNIMTSRGCPFDCHYCGAQIIWQRKVRCRSVGYVMKEIEYLFGRGPIRDISFWDDSFTMNKKYTLELAAGLKERHPAMTFNCITRLDLIDDEIVTALKQAGCNNMLFGIESGSDKMLSLMNKKMSRNFILQQVGLLKKHGMHWIGFFLMGYPGETRQEILQTLSFMKELDPPYAEINIFNPLPGTKIWKDLEASGEVCGDMDFSKYSQSSLNNYFLKDVTQPEFRALALMMVREFDKHNQEKMAAGVR